MSRNLPLMVTQRAVMSQRLRVVMKVVMTREREWERRSPRRQYLPGSRVQPERLVMCVYGCV